MVLEQRENIRRLVSMYAAECRYFEALLEWLKDSTEDNKKTLDNCAMVLTPLDIAARIKLEFQRPQRFADELRAGIPRAWEFLRQEAPDFTVSEICNRNLALECLQANSR